MRRSAWTAAAVVVAVGGIAGCGASNAKPAPKPTPTATATNPSPPRLVENQTAALGTLGHAAMLTAGVGTTFTLTTDATGLALSVDYDRARLKLVDQPGPGAYRFTALAQGAAEVKVTAPVPGASAAIIGDVTVLIQS
jgi:hypothetical protein